MWSGQGINSLWAVICRDRVLTPFRDDPFVTVSLAAAAQAAPGKLPMRTRTGVKGSLLALGCGNRLWMACKDQDQGVEAIRAVLAEGINYLDTAQAY